MGRIDIELSFPRQAANSSDCPHYLQDIKSTVSYGNSKSSLTNATVDTHSEEAKISHHDAASVEAHVSFPFYPIQPRSVADKSLPEIPSAEVVKRDGKDGARLWIVVNQIVLDCTEFKKIHPGGKSIIEGFGGSDCSWQWWSFHSRKIMEDNGRNLRVGTTSSVENKYPKPERKPFKLKISGEQW